MSADHEAALLARLQAIHSALDDALGDRDIDWIESDEQLRDEEPVQWAAKELATLIRARSEPGEPVAAHHHDKEHNRPDADLENHDQDVPPHH